MGRGLTVGNTGLNVGDFISAEFEDMRDEARRFSLRMVSTLIAAPEKLLWRYGMAAYL